MAVYRINKKGDFEKAGSTDLIQLNPVPGSHPLYIEKNPLEQLVYGIVHAEPINISGPTGSAKTSLIEAIPYNFATVCKSHGFPVKPVKIYAIELSTYESPGELHQRRALNNGSTLDEKSDLAQAIEDAAAHKNTVYPLIWLREMGRTHSAAVQGGLLNLLHKGTIHLLGNQHVDGKGIAWVADSNYAAEEDDTYVLVTFDAALKRRFSVNISLKYLSQEQEIEVLRSLVAEDPTLRGIDDVAIDKVVLLGHAVRRSRLEGNLTSIAPPTIYGYLSFLRMSKALSHLSLYDVATATLLGNASTEDEKLIPGVFNQVFGLHVVDDDEAGGFGDNLF